MLIIRKMSKMVSNPRGPYAGPGSKILGHCMVGIGPHHKGVFGPFLWNQRQMKWVIFPPTKHQMVSKSLNQERALGSSREQDFSSRSNIVCASELRLKLEGLFLTSNDQRREQTLWSVEEFTLISRQIGRDAEIESSGSCEEIFISAF